MHRLYHMLHGENNIAGLLLERVDIKSIFVIE